MVVGELGRTAVIRHGPVVEMSALQGMVLVEGGCFRQAVRREEKIGAGAGEKRRGSANAAVWGRWLVLHLWPYLGCKLETEAKRSRDGCCGRDDFYWRNTERCPCSVWKTVL